MFLPFPCNLLVQFCAEQLTLYTVQNYLEVAVLSIIVYRCLRALQSDYIHQVALYAYLYAGAIVVSNVLHAPVLFWILLAYSPVAAILIVITHQTQIQKYVAIHSLKTLHAQALPDSFWIESLIRSCLFAAHHKKNIFCIIMRKQSVHQFLDVPYALHIPIQKDVVDLVLASSMIESPSIMLIDQVGTLKSINASWSDKVQNHMITTAHHSSTQHSIYAASIITMSSDAIVFNIDPITKQATVWCQDSVTRDLSADQLLKICTMLMDSKDSLKLEHVTLSTPAVRNQKEY